MPIRPSSEAILLAMLATVVVGVSSLPAAYGKSKSVFPTDNKVYKRIFAKGKARVESKSGDGDPNTIQPGVDTRYDLLMTPRRSTKHLLIRVITLCETTPGKDQIRYMRRNVIKGKQTDVHWIMNCSPRLLSKGVPFDVEVLSARHLEFGQTITPIPTS